MQYHTPFPLEGELKKKLKNYQGELKLSLIGLDWDFRGQQQGKKETGTISWLPCKIHTLQVQGNQCCNNLKQNRNTVLVIS